MNTSKTPPRHVYPTRFNHSLGQFLVGTFCLLALSATALIWPFLAFDQSPAQFIHLCLAP